ncbi:MAG: undecaprenyldiphospho-muramoylpentapeptide beta-N-acetylglucosaminyltransferase [Pyrinomonadaceae bacterium]|nr:undecaprenyldiphospho-muramoylpentapeptide beta-N-acetylglucosaminyltransferase [Pyrinomonadaceae bacterium]
MKVLFAAGGTGGHIYPAIAVAKEILRRDSASVIKFVGTERGLETKLVPQNGFELLTIDSAGLKNVGLIGQLKGMLLLPKSFLQARKLLKEFQPDVVVGAGGYVTGPVLLMASLAKIPTLVMDSNALPGFTNRQLARFVDKAALTFEESLKFFPNKGVVTGNPVRQEFFEVKPKQREAKLNLLIFGGSQGARAINFAMVDALKNLPKDKINIVHQTGEHDFEKVEQGYKDANVSADIRKYITDMVAEFAKADLVICRAGATTCAELSAAGKVGIMIPLPTAADDHQRKNAEALVNANAAKMILQANLTGESLAKEIESLINSPEKITEMENSARKLARKDAAELTVNIIEELSKSRV